MRRETWNQEKALCGKQVSEIFYHFLGVMASFCKLQFFYAYGEYFFHLGILQDACSMCCSMFVLFISTILVWIHYDFNVKVPYKMRRKNVEKTLIFLCVCHGVISESAYQSFSVFLCVLTVWHLSQPCILILIAVTLLGIFLLLSC
jgi:hypothetical protein